MGQDSRKLTRALELIFFSSETTRKSHFKRDPDQNVLDFSSLFTKKIILSCHVAMILQMKDSWSINLTFRAHN